MTERMDLLESIATTTSDYHSQLSPDHIDRWARQFSADVQLPILREMDHVLKKTYFPLAKVTRFLDGLIKAKKLVGEAPCEFWRSISFLNDQGGGNSQSEMLALFSQRLEKQCGFSVDSCGDQPSAYLYLDDAIFTGNRVLRDLKAWLGSDAPAEAKLHIITIALHWGAGYYVKDRLQEAAKELGKKLTVKFWYEIDLEDRKTYTNTSDVLRPISIPEDADVQAYVAAMKYKQTLRVPGNTGTKSLFSSEAGRHVLEQEFLKAGVRIRRMCPNLTPVQRPLGHMTLEALGFGSLIVTFRNCPNNAPLALWAGDPWYPLFPRTTNRQAAIGRLMAMLTEEGFDAT